VVSVEAYVAGPDARYGSEEDVLITETGCEILTPAVDTGLYVISA
jgi:Xaa-Pro aminopeptidase